MTVVWHQDLDSDMFNGLLGSPLHFDLNMIYGLWYNNDSNFGSLSLFLRCKECPCPLSHHFGLWRMLEVPDWSLESWSWFVYGHWSMTHPWSKFGHSILILKVQRTSMSFKSSFWALAVTFGFGIDFCTVELRKYVDPGLGGFGWVWVWIRLMIS